MAPHASSKRKNAPTQNLPERNAKRHKMNNARIIRTQTADAAYNDGELNVEKFVKAREFEIKALEDGMKRAKHGLSTRAHQELPRELRRRTASHNVKRVPKRLQERAKREMIEDNTPTVTSRRRKPSGHQRLRLETAQRLRVLSRKSKEQRQRKKASKDESEIKVIPENKLNAAPPAKAVKETVRAKKPKVRAFRLREPPMAPAKFRKRQIYKTWLPTHIWHSKRARMSPPKEPVWRFALPLTPHVKSYRYAHRASADKGAIAWDTSYMATIGLQGPEASVSGLLKVLGVGATRRPYDPWGSIGLKWRSGMRTWEGWLHERESPTTFIAPVTVIWDTECESTESGKATKLKRRAFIRIHPSAFFQTWEEVIRLAKVQKPSVTVEDLRFEIGSIEITGPNASEALVAILRPLKRKDETEANANTAEVIWSKLATSPPASLPNNALLHMRVTDPRLHHPPRTLSTSELGAQDYETMQLLATWPLVPPSNPATLFSREARLKATRCLPTQKITNRRKGQADPGEYPLPLPTDPEIPLIAFATRCGSEGSGTWTVMLPWKCVSPAWNSLVYYPLSTGGRVRFGGINEKWQLAYEQDSPWFPADFPATRAGQQFEAEEKARRKAEWDRKPKSRRLEYDSLDLGHGRKGEIGNGWGCDWSRLAQLNSASQEDTIMQDAEQSTNRLTATIQPETALHYLPYSVATKAMGYGGEVLLPFHALATVKISMLGRGRPSSTARIYRLPSKDPKLREKWLAQKTALKAGRTKSKRAKLPPRPDPHASAPVQRSWLAAAILTEPPEPGNKDYPIVPDEGDLVGFVTTGNFSLTEGKGTGIGSLLLERVMPSTESWSHSGSTKGKPVLNEDVFLCIVRDAGVAHGRLASWELV